MISSNNSDSFKKKVQHARRSISLKVAGQRVERKLKNIEKEIEAASDPLAPYSGNQLVSELLSSISENASASSEAVALAATAKNSFFSAQLAFTDTVLQIPPPIPGIVAHTLTPRLLSSPAFRPSFTDSKLLFLQNVMQSGGAGELRHLR